MFRALIFDFDGLIIDTESTELDAWREVFAAHGQALTLDVWSDSIGRPPGSFDPCVHLAALCGARLDGDAIRVVVRERARARASELPLLPGVAAWLDDALRLGIRVGLASSSSHRWVEGHLDRLGLLDRFHAIVCREDTEEHKPHPAPYARAVDRLGFPPREQLGIEDSPHGLASAKAAGVRCIAVPNAVTRSLDFTTADLRLDSLADMRLTEAMRTLAL